MRSLLRLARGDYLRGGSSPEEVARIDVRRVRLARCLDVAALPLLLGGSLGWLSLELCVPTALLLMARALQLRSRNVLLAAPVTFAFVATILAISGTALAVDPDALESLAEAGAISMDHLLSGQLWQIVFSRMVHESWGHVTTNAAWLLGFGLLLEPVLGSRRLAAAVLLGMVGSALADVLFHPRVIGASGVGFAFHGLALVLPFYVSSRAGRPWTIDMTWALTAWLLVLSLTRTQTVFAIAVAGHAGGLITGLSLGLIWTCRLEYRRHPTKVPFYASAAVVLALVAAIALHPRWPVEWHYRIACSAEAADDNPGAAHHWTKVEDLADPDEDYGASAMMRAADFWREASRPAHARRLVERIAPTFAQESNRYIAENLRDERAALETLRRNCSLEPHHWDLVSMANIHLFPEDSTLCSPEKARAYAWCAVQIDDRDSESLRALATAYARLGRKDLAAAWSGRAIEEDIREESLLERFLE